jgi:nucleoid-associated protein YgaU
MDVIRKARKKAQEKIGQPDPAPKPDIEAEVEDIRRAKPRAAKQPAQPEPEPEVADIQDEVEAIRALKGTRAGQPPDMIRMEEEPETEKEEPRIYVVKSGDSLSKIAQEVYGKAGRWKEIYEANKDQIDNPSLIRPGWKLRIP